MAENDKMVFPRIPESNWWVLRDQFAKRLPNEVTVGFLKSLLQLDTEQAARNLIAPLKQLGLIDEDGKPTDLANDWRNNAKYADACQQMIRKVYPQELRDLYGDASADKSGIEDWLQYNGKLGQGTAKKSAAFYMLLLEAAPKSSTDVVKPKSSSKPSSEKKIKSVKEIISATTAEPPIMNTATTIKPEPIVSTPPILSDDTNDDWFSLHIDLQIHISPEANAEQIDNIFASMAKHIMSMKRNRQGGNERN